MRQTLLRSIPTAMLLSALALTGAQQAGAQTDRVVIPQDTIVRLEMENRLNSGTARVGDTFTARLDDKDTSGFPDGTRFKGRVTEVERRREDRPGMLNVRMSTAVLPDGRTLNFDGRLASLGGDSVRYTEDGRLESRRKGGGSSPDWKWAGYGAAGGAVLAEVLGGNWVQGLLLGGLGGAVYGYLNKKGGDSRDFREVDLPQGTEFGMRLDERLAFDNRSSYRYTARNNRPIDSRVAGDRESYRFDDANVYVDGRRVDLGGDRPMDVNGILFVPVRPIAEAANMRFDHPGGRDRFTLQTPGGLATGNINDRTVTLNGRRMDLNNAARLENGTVYVPIGYFARVAEMRAHWDRREKRLELTSYP